MLRCVAIDDEPLALSLIQKYVAQLTQVNLLCTFEDAVTAAEFLRNHPVDLLLLDINMPDISGIDLVKTLEHKPIIIFTTAYKQFAYEGFELEALDYLLKPFDFDRFKKAIIKAEEYFHYKTNDKKQAEECLFVHSEYRLVKIPLSNIEYIESLEDYIRIHLTDSKPVMSLIPLKKVLEKLPADTFKRIHRSYIVPVSKIRSVVNRKIQLTTAELPIGESYNQAVKEWLQGK
ncbi:response regulator transcription factor (plasmid) [Pedobacter sp. BS3]|uniref:LytR/AlgR family response regulator transcription factor n=1 Tax=Pedobacter sp. BS3 TaxID=2567937 RepID=UPI0011F07441|nr:LytTR family DNA-binding domain-containing protein [Pedobacter sp. BS3]TZF85988.1 response regulator transcription factor [Pedobacter sp. BS3]